MTDQLREAFRDLADDAPDIDASAVSSSRTWRRARSARRRGIVAVSFVVVAMLIGGVFVAVGLYGITKSAPAKPMPYNPSQLAIPNEVWQPSEWTPSTDDAGPLGPLALIATAPHRTSWFHTDDDAVFGVSAVTGEYRFIDLPDAEPQGAYGSAVTLSPDGTEVAYWLHGHVPSHLKQSDVNGFAVYDSVTGEVSRHLVPTRFGLQSESLTWTGDSANLVAVFYQDEADTGSGGGKDAPALAWNLRDRSTRRLGTLSQEWPTTGDGASIAYFATPHSMATLNVTTGQQTRTTITGSGFLGGVFSPDGTWLAYSAEGPNGGTRSSLSGIGRITADDLDVASRPSHGHSWESATIDTHSGTTGVVGWLDDSHLLVEVWSHTRLRAQARERFASLDVVSGELTTQIRLSGEEQVWPSLATGLISNAFVPGQAPHDYRDPRVIPIVGLMALTLVVGVFWWLQSSGRRRRVLVGNGARL